MTAYDTTSPVANALLISSRIDQANIDLSSRDCVGAFSSIYPLYNSINSQNLIRTAMASTYGCYANVNILNILNNLTTTGNIAGSAFWEFLVAEFPSRAIPDDKWPQAAQNGIDAVLSVLVPGVILVPSQTVNATSNNPGSLVPGDRESDANAYLTFLSMALMGSLQSRYGLPTSNHHKSVSVPWVTAATTPGDGCAWASALLNFYDGLSYVQSVAPPNAAALYGAISTFLSAGLDVACQSGCTLCGGAVACTTCPVTLRNRLSCTGLTTDVNSCAAAGLATMLNLGWTGPP